LRHVQHYPVGIGEREGADVDLLGQIDDQTRLRVVATEPHVARDRKMIGCARRRAGCAGALGRSRAAQCAQAYCAQAYCAHAHCDQDHCAEERSQDGRADRHGRPLRARLTPFTGVRLTQTYLVRWRPPAPATAPLPSPPASPNKGVLTICSSGCAAFGHPASPPKDCSPTRDGRECRGQVWFAASHGCGAHGPSKPMFLWTPPVLRAARAARNGGAALTSKAPIPRRRSSAQRNTGRAPPALPPPPAPNSNHPPPPANPTP